MREIHTHTHTHKLMSNYLSCSGYFYEDLKVADPEQCLLVCFDFSERSLFNIREFKAVCCSSHHSPVSEQSLASLDFGNIEI